MGVKITSLDSGLTVVTDHIASVETAAVGVWVSVGARHETPELNGVSHMLEHMAFRGTTKWTSQQIAERIEAVGGHLNAYTSREATAYYARVLKNDVPLAINLISDILQYSVFREEELERERGVILQEINQTLDTPDDVVFDHFQGTAYPNQAFGRPIAGTISSVKGLTRQAIRGYMEQNYAASNMVLAAAGNVDHDKIVALAAQDFGDLKPDAHVPLEPARYQGGDTRILRELEQIHLVLGFPCVPLGHPSYYAASVLSTILGGGMSSRLFQEVREKRGLAYTVQSFVTASVDAGLFGVYAGTGVREAQELMPVLGNELARVSSTLGEPEIQRAKTQLTASLMMGLESTSARCERLAQQMMIYGRPLDPSEIIDRIESVTCESLSALASDIFRQKPTLTALGPVAGLETYETFCARLTPLRAAS